MQINELRNRNNELIQQINALENENTTIKNKINEDKIKVIMII